MDYRALFRILDFFVPLDVLTGVLLIFALENVTDYYISLYVGEANMGIVWGLIYLFGILLIAALNFVSADAEEMDELEDDIDDVRDG